MFFLYFFFRSSLFFQDKDENYLLKNKYEYFMEIGHNRSDTIVYIYYYYYGCFFVIFSSPHSLENPLHFQLI